MGGLFNWQPTIASYLNPLNLLSAIQNRRHPPLRDILSGFEGVVRPGEMLREFLACFCTVYLTWHSAVVLGSPGSGSSTFLKTLANHRGEYYAVEGSVHYDSLSPEDIASHYRGDVQYCPEDDVHFPSLTVDQTISFAAKLRAPRSRVNGQTRAEYRRMITDVYTSLFGLRHAMKTRIGDPTIRGVSGGEKKRVSIAEVFVARGLINAWDKCVCYLILPQT